MTVHIALLRAINVGGTKKLAMADLCAFLDAAGFADARTILQSGNCVFASKKLSADRVERLLEEQAETKLGLRTDFITRTGAEWNAVVERNPFVAEARAEPARLHMVAFKELPNADGLETLRAAIKGRERLRTDGRHAYIVYPDGAGASRLTLAVIEKHLGTRGTARNWNTVLKLQAAAAGAL